MNNTSAIQPVVGQYVRPRESFANRPWCLVVEVRHDNSRSYLGRGFVAEYPWGELALQWDGDNNGRFDEIQLVCTCGVCTACGHCAECNDGTTGPEGTYCLTCHRTQRP
jgi:hypothetical protein